MELPTLSSKFSSFIPALEQYAKSRDQVARSVKTYTDYESKLRQIYAQEPENAVTKDEHLVSVFECPERLTTRARNLAEESQSDKDKFLLPLSNKMRRKDGSPATVNSLKEFQTNFNLFSELSLADLDWSNVVAAGSSVVTALLPVSPVHQASKRALRSYYHERLAPASDVDLFLYGLTEEQAIEKIKKIEANVRDSILSETTTIRTKNAITIVSEYPTRHVQIVLRLYKSITEILTGFDVDCACVAYDGRQVWAAPRALAAFANQTNTIDLTRRSPSYENRLSKYAHRGFEVYWPDLDRTRVDPTIYERSFGRVLGLARLLVLEKLPHPSDRDQFLAKRRAERGRPELPWNSRYRHALPGNVKDAQPDDVAEWYDEDDVSSYHTFTIPYGPRYNAKRIEKILFKKDLLLNAEWNKPKDRETKLHRHPAFFGNVEDVIHDCCGFCPAPITDADLAAYEQESKLYISGDMTFMKDDPGRQAIGSFNPLTADDWTDMAYVGNTASLCQAIVDNDLAGVQDWFSTGGGDVNQRDHTGRTPLQLAVTSSSLEIVQYLIDHGARLVSRIYSGMTALHMAAHRGDASIVKAILDRSTANEEEEDRKEDVRKEARRAAAEKSTQNQKNDDHRDEDVSMRDEDDEDEDEDEIEEIDMDNESDPDDNMTEGSFVKVPKEEQRIEAEDNADEPDFYNIDVLSWDAPVSPLHLAIIGGHVEVIELLINSFSADVMLPVKLMTDYVPRVPRAAILSLVLPLKLSSEKANKTIETLIRSGASTAQADLNGATAIHYIVHQAKSKTLDLLQQLDGDNVSKIVMNHLIISGVGQYVQGYENPLIAAIRSGSMETVRKVLAMGAEPEIDFETFAKAFGEQRGGSLDPDEMKKRHQTTIDQPVIEAAKHPHMIHAISELVQLGADVNTLSKEGYMRIVNQNNYRSGLEKSLLDLVHDRIEELQKFTSLESQNENKPVKPANLDLVMPKNIRNYQTWLSRGNLASAEAIHALQIERYQEDLDKWINENRKPGTEEKKIAVQNLRTKYQALATELIAKGAKTFKDLHPDKWEEINNHRNFHNGYFSTSNEHREPFKNKLSFLVPDLTDSKKAAYNKLFEAAYDGDTETVKSLCMEEKDGRAPLQVAVQDLAGFSPFSIALVRGHEELATTILDIAAVQYQPPKDDTQFKYTMRRPHDDEDDEYDSDEDGSDDDSMKLYKELVDAKFTIDDVRALAKNVKSKVSPTTMFLWTCEVWRGMVDSKNAEEAKTLFKPKPRQREYSSYNNDKKNTWPWFHQLLEFEKIRCRWSLVRFAIARNDASLLRYLLHVSKELRYNEEDETTVQAMQPTEDDIEFALQLGRTEMIGEIIRRTGALMPLHRLAQKTGVQIEAKPKYYQGLSVHGQKRADWAQRGHDNQSQHNTYNGSPLLLAIFSGNLESVEYFLSDTPLRRYEEFIETYKDNKQIRSLAAAEGGTDRALGSWMGMRTHLAIHIAVMASVSSSTAVLEYLIKKIPQYLDSKSESGDTALHTALKLQHYKAARLLIAAGADQSIRNKDGINMAHLLYTIRPDELNAAGFRDLISMLDFKIVQSLLTQRCKSSDPGSQTPLALYCDQQAHSDDFEVLDAMLDLSQGKDLRIMDGAGDYILHRLVRQNKNKMAMHIATKNPDLIFVENATGMTPLDVAETAFLLVYTENPPQVNSHQSYYYNPHDILQKQPHEFLPENQEEQQKEIESTFLHVTLRSLADQNPHPRKLVGLLDANEVARRLAEQQQKANAAMKLKEALGLKPYSHYVRVDGMLNGDKQEEPGDETEWWWWKIEQMKKGN